MKTDAKSYRLWGKYLSIASFAVLAVVFIFVANYQAFGIESSLLQTVRTNFINDFIKANRYLLLINGLLVTLEITVFSVLIGTFIGLGIALIKVLEGNGKYIFFLTRFANIYLTVIRGTPVIVQLMIIYYGIFASVNINKIVVAILAFSINSGAYVAEIIRAGILAVDRGQMEAGRTLGLPYDVTMKKIILPQAFKNILPALFNELITLLKETSVAAFIAVADLTRSGDLIRAKTYDPFLPLIAVATIYLIMVVGLTNLVGRLERRLRRGDIR
ncbi:MAG: amino acid ABC transporter permease [Eubacteriales bacterium]|nr:amino acid ABC transporter permease [Eubacteriales bacterium]